MEQINVSATEIDGAAAPTAAVETNQAVSSSGTFGTAVFNASSASKAFSYVTASRVRALVLWGRPETLACLQAAHPVRLATLPSHSTIDTFSPHGFQDGQIVYDFVETIDHRHAFLQTLETYRKIWVAIGIINASEVNEASELAEKTSKALQHLHENCSSAPVVRLLVFHAPTCWVADRREIITVPVDAVSGTSFWCSFLSEITLDLLNAFSFYAKEIQSRTWIVSPQMELTGHTEQNSIQPMMPVFDDSVAMETTQEIPLSLTDPTDWIKTLTKGRKVKITADLYLLSGLIMDALKGYTDAATLAKASDDYLWHASALEGIGVCLVILSFLQIEYQIPAMTLPSSPPKLEKIGSLKMLFPKEVEQNTSKQHIFDFLPDLHMNIIYLYQKSYQSLNDRVPPLCFSESVLRLSKLLCFVHLSGGWNNVALRSIIYDQFYLIPKSHPSGYPPRAEIVSWAMRAYTPYINELDVIDKCRIYGGLASILGMVGFRRARAMFLREIISILTPALIDAKIDGISDDVVCSIIQISLTNYPIFYEQSSLQNSNFLIHNLLDDICDSYGILRMKERSNSRFDIELLEKYGWSSLKITVLNECISFCEALPNFYGVLNFTTKMLSIASTYLSRDNQVRLASNIPRIILAVKHLGLNELEADYWDRNIVQSIEFIPGSSKFIPVLHSTSELSADNKDDTFSSKDLFIYNPFIKKNNITTKHILVEGDIVEFKVVLHNPLAFELECVNISLFTEGIKFEAQSTSVVIGPQRIHVLRLFGCPKEPGSFVVKGCRIHLSGCKDDIFLVNRELSPLEHERLFLNVFCEGKTKFMGLDVYSVVKSSVMSSNYAEGHNKNTLSLPMTIEEKFEVLPAQPVLIVTKTSLVNGSIMLLEGERRVFTIAIKNVSHITINFLLLSFMDSTIDPLKDALSSKNISQEEIYELELFLYERQAFVWKKKKENFFLEPECEEILEIEVLGKRGLTDGKIQIDYGNVKGDTSLDQFYTRRVIVPIIVTVNGSIELVNCDFINYVNDNRMKENTFEKLDEIGSLFQYTEAHQRDGVEYCLGLLDFRNIWPKPLCIYLNVQNEDDEPFKIEKLIYPGETNRVVFPLKKIYISQEDSLKPIPTLSSRQFVVSNVKANSNTHNSQERMSFWLREALFKIISGTWSQPGSDRKGAIELRGLRMTSKMIYCLKVEDISIIFEVSGAVKRTQKFTWLVKLYEFVTFTLKIINRKGYSIKTLIRIQPSLRYQSFIDLSRCVAFNGVTQRVLPWIKPHHFYEEKYTAVFMSRGEYEITTSVQELYGPDKGHIHAFRNYPIVKCVDDIEERE